MLYIANTFERHGGLASAAGRADTAKCIALDTWAGRRYYAVEVVGETPKKVRIRVLTPGGVMLPNRRYVGYGEIALVPKRAIYDMPAESHKIEQGYYNGHVAGFGGTVDAR